MTINSSLLLFGFHPPAFARGLLAEEVKKEKFDIRLFLKLKEEKE